MADAKAGKGGNGPRKTKSTTSKRRTTSTQNQKKPPTKAALKQLAKDWEQVT